MRFEEIYELRTEKRISVSDAAKLLGICERTFNRQCHRYEEEGAEGLYDRRLGKGANNAAPVDEVVAMLNLFETRYSNFSVSHFYDKYREEHKGARSYTWVKNHLQNKGLVNKGKKKGAHRKKRPRAPLRGMLLHQDGSSHEWVPEQNWDLIVTADDANNEIYSGFFVEEEGTWSSFIGVQEVIEKHGLFCSIYTDRGSHYWHTPKSGEKVDKNKPTQFGRAMNQLGIEMIPAYSPEARGRSERFFNTLQNRLPKELALEGITSMTKANAFLRERFIPTFNRRFSVQPKEEVTAFVPWRNGNLKLEDILCVQEHRQVKKDNTISYKGKILQIPKDKYRYSYMKTTVKIHEYVNGDLAIFYGPRVLARYDNHGNLQQKEVML